MKDTASKEVLTSHSQLNKYLLAGLQLNDKADSLNLLCEYIFKLYDNEQITLDEVRRIYYNHFHIDQIEQLHPVILVNCGMLGFEIDRILQSDNTAAKLQLLSHNYALEELSHDSDQNVRSRAELLLYQKEQNELLTDHFKKICSQLNNKRVAGQLGKNESLLVTFVSDMFEKYNARIYACIHYHDSTNAYTYLITHQDLSDYDFTHLDAIRLLELGAKFVIQNDTLEIYVNDDVDAQRVVDILKFFFEEYL